MFYILKIQLVLISVFFTRFNCVRLQCNSNEWACDNDQCILADKLCDGKVDCSDRSDEIAENCIQFHETCQNDTFRCAYGACIDEKAKCNGIRDYADNSDELICSEKDDSDFQGVCFATEIQCLNSKECINSIDLCNGRKDCRDGSDESLELCVNFHCVGFKCGYGACISRNTKCNGIKECADGSDEAWQLCNTTRKSNYLPTFAPFSGCYIPNITEIQDLIFKLYPQNETIPIGSFVDEYDIIHIKCQNKYTLRGQPILMCINGKWNFDFPSCVDLGYCDSTLLRGVSVRAVCDYRTRFVECPKRIRPGTEIQHNCNFGYTRDPDVPQFIKCLPDGTFDKSPLPCIRNCGKVTPYLEVLFKHGFNIKPSIAPWHVSIHENNSVNYDFICSGSIVSPRIVLTAAHCFWNETTLTLGNYTEYQIIAGRSTSNYTTEQNDYTQIVQVDEIHIPEDYHGKSGHQRYDIAFVKLKTGLKYTENVGSICMPNDISITSSNYIGSNRKGFITGFGLNNQLKKLKMINLASHDCYERSPPDVPLSDDKFCVINEEGGSVCRGDSGAGFFIENINTDDFDIMYSLLGVVSSSTPTTKNDCTHIDNDAFVAITNIYYMTPEFKRKLLNALF